MASKEFLAVPKPPKTPKTHSRATSKAPSKMRRQKSYRSQAGSVEFDSLGPIFALPRLPEAFSQFEKGLIRTLDRNLLSDNIEYDDQGAVCALPRLPSDAEGFHTSEEKLVRRVDRRLLPVLGALYAISMIDRANVSAPWSREAPRRLKLTFRFPMRVSPVWPRNSSWTSDIDTPSFC